MNSIQLKKNNQTLITKISGDICNGFKITVYLNETEVGYLIVKSNQEKIFAFDTQVVKQFRRIGIASEMYNLAERLTSKKIYPNEYLDLEAISSNDAVEFWRSRGLTLSGGDKIFDC